MTVQKGGWDYFQDGTGIGSGGKDIPKVIAELGNLANTLGLYTPSRDTITQWAFGQDDTFSAALTPAAATPGLAMDAREMNPAARSLLIIAGGATNYDWQLLGGRNNAIGQAGNIATGAGVATIVTLIPLVNEAYAPWLHLRITNNSGDATYKAVLLGRGG